MMKKICSFNLVVFAVFLTVSAGLSYHLLASCLEYQTFLFESGEFYGDRLLNFSLAKGAQEYGINFLDPYSRQELIFYQFFPYWILGMVAKGVGKNPWEVANFIQIFLAPLYFLVIYKLARELTGSKKTALLSVLIMFAFGSLEFTRTGTTNFTVYGDHAVILNFLRQIYGFYWDNYALLLGYLALVYFWRLLSAQHFDAKTGIGFSLIAACSFSIHFLPAVFFILLFCGLLFVKAFSEDTEKRARNLILISMTVCSYVCFLYLFQLKLPMWMIFSYGLAGFAYFYSRSKAKQLYWAILMSTIPMLLVVGINVSLADPAYNSLVRAKTLYIPLDTLLIAFSPLLILAIISVLKSPAPKMRQYYAAMLVIMAVVVYNNFFGYNNHPYRYIPYVFPLLSIMAANGLTTLSSGLWMLPAKRGLSRIAGGVLLVLTLILIVMGAYANLSTYAQYAYSTSKPVEAKVLDVAAAIEKIRTKDPDAVFWVNPDLIAVERITPYSGAKFFYSSGLSFTGKYSAAQEISKLESFEEIAGYIQNKPLNIDYLVSGKEYSSKLRDFEARYLTYNYHGIFIYQLEPNRGGL